MNTLDQKRQEILQNFEQKKKELIYADDFQADGDTSVYEFGYKSEIGNEIITVTDWGNIEIFIDQALQAYGELVEKKTREKVIEEVKEIAWECLYQEWVEVATPKNFEAGKLNCTLFEKKVNKLKSKQPTTKESNT